MGWQNRSRIRYSGLDSCRPVAATAYPHPAPDLAGRDTNSLAWKALLVPGHPAVTPHRPAVKVGGGQRGREAEVGGVPPTPPSRPSTHAHTTTVPRTQPPPCPRRPAARGTGAAGTPPPPAPTHHSPSSCSCRAGCACWGSTGEADGRGAPRSRSGGPRHTHELPVCGEHPAQRPQSAGPPPPRPPAA